MPSAKPGRLQIWETISCPSFICQMKEPHSFMYPPLPFIYALRLWIPSSLSLQLVKCTAPSASPSPNHCSLPALCSWPQPSGRHWWQGDLSWLCPPLPSHAPGAGVLSILWPPNMSPWTRHPWHGCPLVQVSWAPTEVTQTPWSRLSHYSVAPITTKEPECAVFPLAFLSC